MIINSVRNELHAETSPSARADIQRPSFLRVQTLCQDGFRHFLSALYGPATPAGGRPGNCHYFINQQAHSLLSIYVNRDAKMDTYGIRDPLEEASRIRSLAAKMTDSDLHFSLSKLFLSLRDLHTNYFFPAPYQCYAAVSPLEFDFAQQNSSLIVVVRRKNLFPEVHKLIPDQIMQKIQIGDELVAIDGRSFEDYYQSHKNSTGGKWTCLSKIKHILL